jgi:hypothetical protein
MMDEIERNVTLPTGARPIGRYARSYTGIWNKTVFGVYTASPQDDVPLGYRRWFNDIHQISPPAGEGCAVVNVMYDPRDKRLVAVCEHGSGEQ